MKGGTELHSKIKLHTHGENNSQNPYNTNKITIQKIETQKRKYKTAQKAEQHLQWQRKIAPEIHAPASET
jgi:hypothetical protein